MIRVVLVDDQSLFRAGVRMLIASQPEMPFSTGKRLTDRVVI